MSSRILFVQGGGAGTHDEIPARADLAERLPSKVFLYYGTTDETVPVAHAELYARALPQATVRMLPGRDHQLNNDLSEVADDIRLFER